MSIDGLSDGTTGRVVMSLSVKNRVRMSLAFEATTNLPIGAPICLAIHPANTLPKLPLGTQKLTVAAQMIGRGHVVDDLGHHPGPVDGVHRAEAHPLAERAVVEHRLDQVLAVVEGAVDRDDMHVRRLDRCHLPSLDLARATLREQDDDVGVGAVPHPVDRRRAGVAGCRSDDRDPATLVRQDVFEQPSHHLQGDIFERQRRAVEQLLQEVLVADLHQRHDGRMVERGVRVGTHRRQSFGGDLVADERLHDLRGAGRVGHAAIHAAGAHGHSTGTYRPPSVARPASSTSVNPSSAACPRVETYRMSAADHTKQTTDVAHDIEIAQLAHRCLHRGFACFVGDEHQPGLWSVALLLGGTDADVVTGEHAGDRVQHAWLVGDIEAQQVLGRCFVDGAHVDRGRSCRSSRAFPSTG